MSALGERSHALLVLETQLDRRAQALLGDVVQTQGRERRGHAEGRLVHGVVASRSVLEGLERVRVLRLLHHQLGTLQARPDARVGRRVRVRLDSLEQVGRVQQVALVERARHFVDGLGLSRQALYDARPARVLAQALEVLVVHDHGVAHPGPDGFFQHLEGGVGLAEPRERTAPVVERGRAVEAQLGLATEGLERGLVVPHPVGAHRVVRHDRTVAGRDAIERGVQRVRTLGFELFGVQLTAQLRRDAAQLERRRKPRELPQTVEVAVRRHQLDVGEAVSNRHREVLQARLVLPGQRVTASQVVGSDQHVVAMLDRMVQVHARLVDHLQADLDVGQARVGARVVRGEAQRALEGVQRTGHVTGLEQLLRDPESLLECELLVDALVLDACRAAGALGDLLALLVLLDGLRIVLGGARKQEQRAGDGQRCGAFRNTAGYLVSQNHVESPFEVFEVRVGGAETLEGDRRVDGFFVGADQRLGVFASILRIGPEGPGVARELGVDVHLATDQPEERMPPAGGDGQHLEACDPCVATRDVRQLVGDQARSPAGAGERPAAGRPQEARGPEAPDRRRADAFEQAHLGSAHPKALGDGRDLVHDRTGGRPRRAHATVEASDALLHEEKRDEASERPPPDRPGAQRNATHDRLDSRPKGRGSRGRSARRQGQAADGLGLDGAWKDRVQLLAAPRRRQRSAPPGRRHVSGQRGVGRR